NFVAAVHLDGEAAGVAFADVSTGEFSLSQTTQEEMPDLLQSIIPAELLLTKKAKNNILPELQEYNTTFLEEWIYEGDYGYNLLTDHFETHSLKGFGVDNLPTAQIAAGALMHYIQETQKATLGHIRR